MIRTRSHHQQPPRLLALCRTACPLPSTVPEQLAAGRSPALVLGPESIPGQGTLRRKPSLHQRGGQRSHPLLARDVSVPLPSPRQRVPPFGTAPRHRRGRTLPITHPRDTEGYRLCHTPVLSVPWRGTPGWGTACSSPSPEGGAGMDLSPCRNTNDDAGREVDRDVPGSPRGNSCLSPLHK